MDGRELGWPGSPAAGTFELSLAMTGTASAGAYSAGVLDFLQEALDAWEEARARGDEVPAHRVILRGLAGNSGGAIAGAIFAAGLAKVQAGPTALHQAWVDLVDYQDLCAVPPDPERPLTSLLDSGALDTIARTVLESLEGASDTTWRAWAGDPFTLRLVQGNLTGVPYWLPMDGASGAGDGYVMIDHADYSGYGVSPSWADPLPGDRALPSLAKGRGRASGWARALSSSISSAALPVVFRSRTQTWPMALRNDRPFLLSTDRERFVRVPPCWPEGAGHEYTSFNVDGGILDNEPLDLAREILAGRGAPDERAPERAQRMVLMVAPFVKGQAWDPSPVSALWQGLIPLLSAWLDQSAFKTEDLLLAARVDVASRWLIAPRNPAGTVAPPTPIFGAGLGTFGAFLHHAFRQYDYDLGRFNCQAFLRDGFRLPGANPGFGMAGSFSERAIIPLLGQAALPVPVPVWPGPGTFKASDLAAFRACVGHRLDFLEAGLARDLGLTWAGRAAASLAWRLWPRGRILDAADRAVQAFLKAYRVG
jgi:hypothetical protein